MRHTHLDLITDDTTMLKMPHFITCELESIYRVDSLCVIDIITVLKMPSFINCELESIYMVDILINQWVSATTSPVQKKIQLQRFHFETSHISHIT